MLFKIAPDYHEANLIKRENRFTLLLEKNRSKIKAYLPNSGRLEEFMIPGHTFYITSKKEGKLQYRCISTLYKNNIILLDTHKVQKIIKELIERKIIIPEGIKSEWPLVQVQEEYTAGKHRIDLLIKYEKQTGRVIPALIEAKSCTLCHNGVGMFPDAPSKRAENHIKLLKSLKKKGYKTYIVFLIPNPSANLFIPNIHTDPEFSRELLSSEAPEALAYRITLLDPVTVDLSSVKSVPIDSKIATRNLQSGGSYIIVMKSNADRTLRVGSLGEIKLKRGYYIYIGSALNNLEKRIKRHMSIKKTKRWHIDYIVPEQLRIIKDYKIRRKEKLEERIVEALGKLSDGHVDGFGAGDSRYRSHLLYFKSPPHLNEEFIERILDFMTFSEKK